MTAQLTYVAMWPIVDRSRPVSALVAEACCDLDIMAALAGARIVEQPHWSVSTDLQRLVCLAAAQVFDPDQEEELTRDALTAGQIAHIHRLAMNGWSGRRIADVVGCSARTASHYAKQVR